MNNGTSAMRNPNTDQPVAKFDSSAARYARCRNATRTDTVGSDCSAGAASDECRRLKNTTAAAISSAPP